MRRRTENGELLLVANIEDGCEISGIVTHKGTGTR